jgi:dihydroxy-acid dehydratase
MANGNKTSASLRSARWFAPDDVRSSGRRSRMMQIGYAPTEIEGLGQYSDEPRWIP